MLRSVNMNKVLRMLMHSSDVLLDISISRTSKMDHGELTRVRCGSISLESMSKGG